MVRTQIYLSRSEYDFVQAESTQRGEPMAAVIRSFIDEKMQLPEDAWTNNPMLQPTPVDPDFKTPCDAAINHLDFAILELRDMKMQPALERALRHRGLLKA